MSHRHSVLGVLAVCGTALHFGNAGAQEAEPTAKSQFTVLEEVTVTARRQEETLMEVPVSANVVSGTVLQNNAIFNLSNLSALVPGISLDKIPGSNKGTLTIRGVGSSGSDASTGQSVATVVDGLATSRGAFLLSSLLDVAQIEVLKGPQALYFGKDSPGGVVSLRSNGPTDQFSGYVNVQYEADAQERAIEGAISGPLTDTLRARLAVRATDMDGWMDIVGSPQPNLLTGTIPGYPAAVGAPLNTSNASEQVTARLTVDYKPTENFTATFRYFYDTATDNGETIEEEVTSCPGGATVPVFTRIPDPENDCVPNNRSTRGNVFPNVAASSPVFAVRPYGEYDASVTSLTLDWTVGAFDITSMTGIASYERSAVANNANPYSIYTLANVFDYEQRSQELRLVSNFESPINFLAGVYIDTQDFSANNPVVLFATPADPRTGSFLNWDLSMRSNSESFSVFGEMRWDITDQLRLDAGARYSRDEVTALALNTYVNPVVTPMLALLPAGVQLADTRKFSDTSPQVTLTWTPNDDVLLFGTWRNGYKSGNPTDFGIIPASSVTDDLFYRPEEIEGFEIGVKALLLDSSLRLTGAIFSYDYSDLQISNFDQRTNINQTLNAGGMRTEGFEIGADYVATDALSVNIGIAYTDARYTDFDVIACYSGQTAATGCLPNGRQDLRGQQRFRSPLWTGNLNFTYDIATFGESKLRLNGTARYSDSYFTSENNNPSGIQDAFLVYDAGLQLANDRWVLAILGRNLGDENYVMAGRDAQGFAVGTTVGVVARPRQLWLRADFKF